MHLQQPVEKYLKGWLLDRGWGLRRTHEVASLVDDASKYVPSLQAYRGLGERLSDYYLVERYPPAGLAGPSETLITADLAEARRLVLLLFPDETLSQ
jgi:HEPN domain-containing protein